MQNLISACAKANKAFLCLSGLLLADSNYDVWLGNFRGSVYSRRHLSLNSNIDRAYWNFSFHEHGVHDIRTFTNHIYDVTKQKVIYVGYSLGTTAALVYSSTYPDEAYSNTRIQVQMAPIAWFHNFRSPVRRILGLWPIVKVTTST